MFFVEPPLQRHYLLAYVESAKIAGQHSATTPVVWLYKTAPGRRHVLLTERDVQATNSGTLGVRLSPAALADGWTGIEAGAQEQVNSAELEAFLQANIYDGHSYGWVVAEPLLLGFSRVAGLFAVVIVIRRRSRVSTKSRRAAWKADQGSGTGFGRRVEYQSCGQMVFDSSWILPRSVKCSPSPGPSPFLHSGFAETLNRATS